MAIMLPTVKLNGKEYFVDARLRQIRNTRTPHDYKDFNELTKEEKQKVSMVVPSEVNVWR